MPTATETPLKRILRLEGRKQSWLAEQIGASPTQVSYWVNGLICPPDVQDLIAEVLERDVDELFPDRG